MKNQFLAIFTACALVTVNVMAQVVANDDLDISNQIELPNCNIDVKLTAKRRPSNQSDASRPLVAHHLVSAFIELNGKSIKVPIDFLALAGDASSIKNPTSKVSCGFIIVVGDASTSGRLLARISNGRIESLERIDSKGITLSKTQFFYPKLSVLN
jgi:hypothetical protein